MSFIQLKIDAVKDPVVREALQIIRESLNKIPLLRGEFEHFALSFEEAITGHTFNHNLGFQPKDVVQTFLTGTGQVTWNYADFTKTKLSITVTGPCTVRAFIGAYKEQTSA